MKIAQHNLLAVACATLLLVLAPAHADGRHKSWHGTRYAQNDTPSESQDNGRKQGERAPRDSGSQSETPSVSRSEAAGIAERATGGRVLSVRESGSSWQVKVLVDDKRVRVVNVDMRSGQVR